MAERERESASRRAVLALGGAAVAGALVAPASGGEAAAGTLVAPPNGGEAVAKKRKAIVLGAHPDDPETGCGGTMLRLAAAGWEVVSGYLTRGEAGIAGVSHAEAARIRTAEAEAACALLGARPLFFGQVDGATSLDGARYDEARSVLAAEAPDLVLAHWPLDTHRDHRVASLLAYDAWLVQGRPFALYYFEVMTGSQSQLFHPTDYVDVGPVVERKHRACFVHRSQGIEPEYAKDHGRMELFRGMEAGVGHAEALVRHPQSVAVALP